MAEYIDRVTPGFTILVARPASGKSHLAKYLLMLDHPDYNKNPIRYGLIFTTTKFNGYWNEIFPPDYVHPRYDSSPLQSLMDIQRENNQHRAVVVFDDCLDQKAFASQLFLDLSTTFRHYNIDVYILVQYLYKIPPVVREVATRVGMFRITTERSLKACYESFGSFFKRYDDFRKFLIDRTGDYKFLWYIANSSKENIDEIYYVMKAPERVPDIKFEY